MTCTATITSNLNINSNSNAPAANLYYNSQPQSFSTPINTPNGPSPGSVLATQLGTSVSFSTLVQPSLCRISNLDTVNTLVWGAYLPSIGAFIPIGEVLPGEFYVFRIAKHFGAEYYETGTGSFGGHSVEFQVRGLGASVIAVIEAFEY